jgi:hypothetical protein
MSSAQLMTWLCCAFFVVDSTTHHCWSFLTHNTLRRKMLMRWNSLCLVTLAVLLCLISVSNVAAGGRPLGADLSGAAEIPGPGDPDGTGVALVTLNQGQGEVCFQITVIDITLPATAAHIHRGTIDVAGPVVVGLAPPDASGVSIGCIFGVDAALIKEIRQHPDDFYVNVHTSDFPAGAVRGQLSK